MQPSIEINKHILIETLGNIVKEFREAKGKTIYAISAEASMSKSTWREVELALCKDINFSTLWKIAEGLEISLSKIIDELRLRLGEDFSLIDLD